MCLFNKVFLCQAGLVQVRALPAAVSIFLRTNNGTYAYSSNKNKGIQGAQVETLRITVGNTLPTPTKVGGDILNTIVFDNSLDLSVQGTTISFLPTATGRYVALQLRYASWPLSKLPPGH